MNDAMETVEGLSPKKRELLDLLMKEKSKGSSRTQPIPQRLASDTFPASFAQQRLWLADQMTPGTTVYSIPFARRITGRLNEITLGQSLTEIVRRHENLRATFGMSDGHVVGRIGPAAPVLLQVIDQEGLPDALREGKARRWIAKEARHEFDLASGPLLRASLLKVGEDDYIVVLNMHHMISDGWSLGVLLRELALLYQTLALGAPSPLLELRIQYADYAIWQRELLQGEVLQTQLTYWRQRLDGVSGRLELPTDRPRPAAHTSRGATQSLTLPRPLPELLKSLSRQYRVTLFMTMLAAFKALLHRYTGQADLVVGSPIANRSRPELEELMGFFVNTLVLRTELGGDPSFEVLLGRVRETALQAYDHQDLPFERLVQELQPERDHGHPPMFQVMFTVQNVPLPVLDLAGVQASHFECSIETSMFDLTMTVLERSDEGETDEVNLVAYVEYNTDLFDALTVARMLEHYKNVLGSVAADPHQRLSAIPLMSDTEKRRVLVELNDTSADYPQDRCLHELFDDQVRRAPDAIAAIFRGQELSYGELSARANRVAWHLASMGVGPDVMAGIFLDRGFDLPVGLLGILKAGGAYLPLDPNSPQNRLGDIVDDARVAVILTSQRLKDRLPNRRARTVLIDSDPEFLTQSDESLPNRTNVENVAYVIHTSGSAGRPKGVLITHGSLVNHNLAVASEYGLTADDRVLHFASISFDVAAEELFPTWLVGAAVIIPSHARVASRPEFLQLLRLEQSTIVNLPATFWHEWVDEIARGAEKLPAASFRLLIVGSERVSPEKFTMWRKMVDDSWTTVNAYGATEATITATIYRPAGDECERSRLNVPVGRPIANARTYILDGQMQPAPVGIPGELHIAGAGLARGYLDRPDLSGERFLPNPFARVPGQRMYRTGDSARFLSDGNIEVLGRIDRQTKIRGFRVEPAEIESVIETHRSVRSTFVMLREDGGQQYLAGYVVPKENHKLTGTELRRFLADRLPDYMIPSSFVILQSIPLTSSGKVDRNALPRPEKLPAELEAAHVSPRTKLEATIASIWRDVLGLKELGVNDNFYDLGGHSLYMAEIFSRLQHSLGKELTMVDLFEYPTVASLSRYLSRENSDRSVFDQGPGSLVKSREAKSRLKQQFKQRQLPAKRR
jgi:amino acid adenylation domain-containing protein